MKTHSPAFLRLVNETKVNVREITIDTLIEFRTSQKPIVLIDVREDHEWQAGHIPGALHIGKGILERDIEVKVPEFDQEIVLYCGGGFRSTLAADALQKMGFTKVYSLAGGWSAWKEKHP